jgi:hypothetical protein
MFEALMGVLTGCLVVVAYWVGKFRGAKEVFDRLEKKNENE